VTTGRLEELLRRSAERFPDRIAVQDAGLPEDHAAGSITYGTLDREADGLAQRLIAVGIRPGDRVVVRIAKSIGAVIGIFGVLKAGAAYVPQAADAPAARNDRIAASSGAAALLTVAERGGPIQIDLLQRGDGGDPQLSYILFTSGSTGEPKGVAHTHASALSFVDWAAERFAPTADDVFASHAPFTFDLSIFDLFVPLGHGATLVLFDEGLGRFPAGLAQAIAERRISVWYSTPSTLRMLMAYGRMERHSYPALRLVLYAGEVFAANQLRELKQIWPAPAYANLYGPTETNVCTYYEVPDRWDEERVEPFPIGICCENDQALVVDGELCIRGGTVMAGYWGQPELTEAAFLTDADGARWYRTGDLVQLVDDGNYQFLGRRDRMVKRQGYRIELGEIEAVLGSHERVTEAAVVSAPHPDQGVEIRAYMTIDDGEKPSLVAFKTYSARNLPSYMIPDRFVVLEGLPRTSTDKIDYRTLEGLA